MFLSTYNKLFTNFKVLFNLFEEIILPMLFLKSYLTISKSVLLIPIGTLDKS